MRGVNLLTAHRSHNVAIEQEQQAAGTYIYLETKADT